MNKEQKDRYNAAIEIIKTCNVIFKKINSYNDNQFKEIIETLDSTIILMEQSKNEN